MKYLFEISTNHPDPVHTTMTWSDKAEGDLLCPACKKIRPSWYPRPVDIVLKKYPSNRIMAGVGWVGVRIFHIMFVEQIRKYLSDDNVIGKCIDTKGKIIDEYVTCYSNKIIVERGDRKRKYRVCPECGSILSWAPRIKYILQTYLTEAKVYQDVIGVMFLDEELALSIDFSLWPDAELRPIEVRDEPLDGQHLPGDPPELVVKYPEQKWEYGPTAAEVRERELKSEQEIDARFQAIVEKYGPHILDMLKENQQ